MCAPTNGCAKQYAAGSMDKGFVSNQRMAMKEMLGIGEEWDPIEKRGNPCLLTCVSNTQKQVGVSDKQADPLLTHDFASLLQDLRQLAQSAGSTSARIYPRHCAVFLGFRVDEAGLRLTTGVATTRVGRAYF